MLPPPDDPAPARRISRAPLIVAIAGLALAGMLVYLGAKLAAVPAASPDLSRPGTAAQPRDVNVIMRDYVFNPTPLYLVAGETVTLRVINGGMLNHELVLGDQAVQLAWAQANAAASPAGPLSSPPRASVAPGTDGVEVLLGPGQSAALTYSVPVGQRLELVCHLPGHVERGMVGSVILPTP